MSPTEKDLRNHAALEEFHDTSTGRAMLAGADRIAALERENAKLREVGNELARIVAAPPDSDYKTWPSDEEIDAAIAAWRKL